MIKYANKISEQAQEAIENIKLENTVNGEEFEQWLKTLLRQIGTYNIDELIQVLEEFLENLKNNNDEKHWMIKPFIYIGVLSLMKT